MPTPVAGRGVDRRTFMGLCSVLGLGRGLPATLWTAARPSRALAQAPQTPATVQAPPRITRESLIAEAMIGLEPTDATPVSLVFLGRLFGKAELLSAVEAYQGATGFHTRCPPKFV